MLPVDGMDGSMSQPPSVASTIGLNVAACVAAIDLPHARPSH
jgi:hypothetical protein